jgi:NAD(P)-dependent dehydrogenase (short-subunit alcohol dehydrogenase family)
MTSVSFSLDAETALVTGGASGIGAAVALAIAEQGGQVAIVDLPGTDFSVTLDSISRAGGRAISIEADVTSLEQLEDAVARTESELGALSLAVNSAGIANAAPAEDMPLAQWQRVYDIDVTGVFLSCQAEGRAMLRSGRGSIVNIASMSGTIVNRGLMQVHYNSAKAAVQHLSKSLAMEWADRGVRVNSISPGYTMTPMNSRPEMVDQMAQFASETPMQRVAEPREIAGPVVFLLSGAASFCTGTDLLVDGGFCAW